jgi:hypothetical protein
MDMEAQLRTALNEAASTVPSHPSAWADNTERVRRYRRRRAVVLPTAFLAATAGLGAATFGLSGSPSDRLEVEPGTTLTRAPGYVLARPSAYTDVYGPVRLGSVDVKGRVYDVVVFLGKPVMRRPGATDLSACVAVADERGVVGELWADPCEGPARVQGGNNFVGQLTPLRWTGLPALPCSYGPMGNVDAILTSASTASVSSTGSAGSVGSLDLVAGTEGWPVRVFTGAPPAGEVFSSYLLKSADGTVIAEVPLGGPANGCVKAAPGG